MAVKALPRRNRLACFLGGASVLFYLLYTQMPFDAAADRDELMRASERMAAAEKDLWACREQMGLAKTGTVDFNRTGLIGIETSPMTTTLGNPEAKRTVTNPNMAGLMVRLLKEAGVKKGDVIAVGASCSFPGLILAVFSAAGAMDVDALFICSLGASQWGANDPDFHWLDMRRCLAGRGNSTGRLLALTLGGEKDIGQDMSEEGRRFLLDEIRKSGRPFIEEPDLVRNVTQRIRIYDENARGKKIKAFINIGGGWANMGTDASVLRLEPGLTRIRDIPPPDRRGVMQEMAVRGIPVIHLLNIKGLVGHYGLPWDPSPLPRPGKGEIYRSGASARRTCVAFFGVYALLIGLIVILYPAKSPKSARKTG